MYIMVIYSYIILNLNCRLTKFMPKLYMSYNETGYLVHVEFCCCELTGRGALPRVLFIQAATGRDVQQVSLFHFNNAT